MEFEDKGYVDHVWARVAAEHPEFTRAHDALGHAAAVESLVLNNFTGFAPFTGARVMDLGANAGLLTALWALNGCQVTAYEADPVTYGMLRRMLERTSLTDRVEAINAAIWTFTGTIAFRGDEQHYPDGKCLLRNGAVQITGAGKHGDGDNTPGRFRGNVREITDDVERIPCVSLEEAIGKMDWDCIKVDIEGAEFQILLAVPVESLKRVKFMHIEFHHGWADDEVYRRVINKLGPIFHIEGAYDTDKSSELYGRWHWVRLSNREKT